MPRGYVLDHVSCGPDKKHCCNPDPKHLEIVTRQENTARGWNAILAKAEETGGTIPSGLRPSPLREDEFYAGESYMSEAANV